MLTPNEIAELNSVFKTLDETNKSLSKRITDLEKSLADLQKLVNEQKPTRQRSKANGENVQSSKQRRNQIQA